MLQLLCYQLHWIDWVLSWMSLKWSLCDRDLYSFNFVCLIALWQLLHIPPRSSQVHRNNIGSVWWRALAIYYLNPDLMSTAVAIEKFSQTKIYGGFGLWPLPIWTMDPHVLAYSALDTANTVKTPFDQLKIATSSKLKCNQKLLQSIFWHLMMIGVSFNSLATAVMCRECMHSICTSDIDFIGACNISTTQISSRLLYSINVYIKCDRFLEQHCKKLANKWNNKPTC